MSVMAKEFELYLRMRKHGAERMRLTEIGRTLRRRIGRAIKERLAGGPKANTATARAVRDE